MKTSIRQAAISGLRWAVWLAVSSILTVQPVFAQNQNAVEPWVEYHKQIEGTEHIAALEEGFAGDSVSLYDGATSFSVTDISIPGNFKLPVQLVRRVSIELQVQGISPYDTRLGGAGNWDVDVPYMTATYPTPGQPGGDGWQAQRCSGTSVPPATLGPDLAFWGSDAWSGINIHVPGRGDSKALAVNTSVPLPTSGGPYHLTTSARDVLDCIPMRSGLSGEGFRLTTASGVQYYFDVGTTRVASELTKWSSVAGQMVYLMRTQYYLLVSKVEDRFGNWVQYQYDANGHPTRIWSSDGREIDLTYSGNRLVSATSDSRKWQYQYDSAGNLSEVTLPDTSHWRYTYSGSLTPQMPPPGENFINAYCDLPPPLIADAYALTATGPSGAAASFQFQNTRHGRSGVIVNECINIGKPLSPVWSLRTANFFDVMSLTQKTISGPGIPTATWTYSYGGVAHRLWGTVNGYNPYPCTTCQLDKTNIVTEPDGTQRHYRFGVEYARNDGRQLETDTVLADGSTIVRSKTDDYLSESAVSGQPFYPQYGDVLGGVGDPATANIRPTVDSTISQDGASFTTTTSTFDSLARPLTQTESSSLGYSRTTGTSYHDDDNLWVLGQTSETSVNGIAASEITYTSKAQPFTEKRFGKLQQTFTWNPDGTLASVKDGNNYVTTASNWKRGIPQAIGYPDGTSESAGVNDSGWITSVTDEKGFITNYGYDAMGRLASITYPSGDDITWNPTLLSFAPIGSSEYGIPAGHWKQTIHTGNGYVVAYFDALWRPLVTEHYDAGNKSATLSQVIQRYDAMGREVFASYPTSVATSYTQSLLGTSSTYDALNRVTQVLQDSEIGSLPTTTVYQAGFTTKVTDPRGYSTTTSYQAFGESDTSQPVSIAMPEDVTVTILRDAFGKPLSVKRSGSYDLSEVTLTRSFVYDGNQLLCKRIDPETGATLFAYDGANNLAWSAPGTSLTGNTCDRGSVTSSQTITRSYDARNRLLSIIYPDHLSDTEYTYAADGAMSSAINENGGSRVQTDYGYDMRRLLISERLTVPGASTFAIGYGHDANGHLKSLSYPDGRILAFAPNALGQPTQAGSYATGVSYFPNGAIKQFAYGDGSVHTLTQNLRGLPERSRDSYGPTAVLDNTAAYDGNGNVAGITDGLPGNVGNIDMSYDGLDRLTATTSPVFAGNHQANFTYDPLDNLRSAGVGNGNQYAYSYDPTTNLLTSMVGSQTFDFGYDVHGNVIHSNAQAYTFDMADRLRSANGLETYLYDAAGRRARKSSAFTGSTTYYAYDKAGSLLYESDSAGTTSAYVYLGGSLIAKVSVVPPAPPPPPPAPASISVPASSSTGDVSISWSAVDGATGYVLQQQFNGGSWTQVYTGAATSTSRDGLANGSYVYRVQACNANGCGVFATSGTLIVDVPQPPPAPASINVPTSSSTGSITISWSPVGGATGYVLLQQFNGGSWTQVYSGTATSKAISGLANGSYVYRVQACNANGCGAFATSGTLTVALIPPAPASINVPASSYGPSIAVNWSASANTSNYVLEESVNGGGWGVAWNGNATSTTVTVSSSGTYRFQVSACGAGGCSGFTASGNVVVTLPPASAPSLSGPSSSTTGTFTLTWNAVAGATRYQLNQTLGGTVTTPYNAGGTSWTSSSLGNGTYSYQTFACNAAGCSSGSNVLAVTVQAIPIAPGPVAAPLSAYINVPFTVSWSAVSGATRYDLQQTNLGNGTITTPYSGTATSKVITLSGPADTMFQYAARACNSAGCSAWVNAVRKTYLNYKSNPTAVPASGSSGP